MFKVIHIETDLDIQYGLEILKGPTAPEYIILNIKGTSYMFLTREAIEVMEDALEDAESDEAPDVAPPAQENDPDGKADPGNAP